jgi:hypothetical protein
VDDLDQISDSQKNYLELVKNISLKSERIIKSLPLLDYSTIFHTLMNLELQIEERLKNGLKQGFFAAVFPANYKKSE